MRTDCRPVSVVPIGLVLLAAAALAFAILYAAFLTVLASGASYSHQHGEQVAQNAAIIAYLRGPLFAQESLLFLSQAERAHMADVKALFDWASIIFLVALGALLGVAGTFAAQRMWSHLDELLGRAMIIGGWTILGTVAFLGAAASLSFGNFWLLFHAILFPQGNWMFAADSTLITLYPAEFFVRFVTQVLLRAGAFGAIMLLLGYFLRRMRHAHAQFEQRATAGRARTRRGG